MLLHELHPIVPSTALMEEWLVDLHQKRENELYESAFGNEDEDTTSEVDGSDEE